MSITRIPAQHTQQWVYVIQVLLCVQCWTPGDGQRDCSKHVEFHSKNKFGKLVHLVGFVIRIHHHARSSECHVLSSVFNLYNLLYSSNTKHKLSPPLKSPVYIENPPNI